MMQIGQTHTSKMRVKESQLAVNVGSGTLNVLSTPSLSALMENAAMLTVSDFLDHTSTTVGGYIEIHHQRPSKIDTEISATATLIAIEGRKLTFQILAEDEKGIIAEGKHIRYVVNIEKFLTKL